MLFASQCWADTTAHSPPQDVPVQRGRSDAYYSCLETFENSEVSLLFGASPLISLSLNTVYLVFRYHSSFWIPSAARLVTQFLF